MDLSSIGTMTITMGSSVFMANVPAGSRLVIDFADVVVEGERLKARKAKDSPAGDWLVIGSDNVATLDRQREILERRAVLVHPALRNERRALRVAEQSARRRARHGFGQNRHVRARHSHLVLT